MAFAHHVILVSETAPKAALGRQKIMDAKRHADAAQSPPKGSKRSGGGRAPDVVTKAWVSAGQAKPGQFTLELGSQCFGLFDGKRRSEFRK